ncbi:MAG: hypothetical protein ACO1SX_13030 [Actinomycetota bacterium]
MTLNTTFADGRTGDLQRAGQPWRRRLINVLCLTLRAVEGGRTDQRSHADLLRALRTLLAEGRAEQLAGPELLPDLTVCVELYALWLQAREVQRAALFGRMCGVHISGTLETTESDLLYLLERLTAWVRCGCGGRD